MPMAVAAQAVQAVVVATTPIRQPTDLDALLMMMGTLLQGLSFGTLATDRHAGHSFNCYDDSAIADLHSERLLLGPLDDSTRSLYDL